MLKFYPRLTNDGSISLFNEVIDDIYHSTIGAFTEALMKFVYPSKILETKKEKIELLDICYGLGYNTKALLTKLHEKRLPKKINIDAIEIDENVLALSLIMKDDKTPYFIQQKIIDSIIRDNSVEKINYILKDKRFKPYISFKNVSYIKKQQKRGCKYTRESLNGVCLHNIYYKYISTENIVDLKNTKKLDFFKIKVHINDARKVLYKVDKKYDYVFHDGFDPKKQAVLWTQDFFSKLYALMTDNSNITTYTSSSIVRGGAREAGFSVGVNRYKEKSVGSIFYKGSQCSFSNLILYEEGLLLTRAGIPYKDNEKFELENNDIINNRLVEVISSDRMTSSKYIKERKHAK